MREDETGGGRGRSVDGPDPSFIKRLEDDVLWSSKPDGEGARRATRENMRASRAADARRRRQDRRKARRARWITAAVLLVVAVVIALVGVEIKASEYGSSGGKTTPFSILPIDSIRVTTTTEPPAPSTTTTSAAVTTSTSTTSTTTPVAIVTLR